MADGDNKQTPSILLAHLASKNQLYKSCWLDQPLISYIAEISKDHKAAATKYSVNIKIRSLGGMLRPIS